MKTFDPLRYLPLAKEAVAFILASGAGIWTWMRVRQAHSWPSTQGTIWQVEARSAEGRSHVKPWVAQMTYSYSVGGEYYSGIHHIAAFTERKAENMVAGWKDRMVVVRYSPDKPDLSVLLKSDQPGGQLGN